MKNYSRGTNKNYDKSLPKHLQYKTLKKRSKKLPMSNPNHDNYVISNKKGFGRKPFIHNLVNYRTKN